MSLLSRESELSHEWEWTSHGAVDKYLCLSYVGKSEILIDFYCFPLAIDRAKTRYD